MKKFLTMLMVLAAMASVAVAGVGIAWESGWGGYTHDAPNIVDDPSAYAILDHYSVIWQLIYAGADNTINPIPNAQGDPLPVAGGPNGDYVQGDDVVWAQRTIATAGATAPEDGTTWNNFMFRVSGDQTYVNLSWNTAGFVYQRVFEGTPGYGTYWYDSPLFAFNEAWTDSLPAEGFNTEPAQGAGFQAGNQFPPAVPEPATMSLLGLGALVMAIRRRRS